MNDRSSFGSKFGIIAAVGGSVVGLGNIWRFPYIAGENGGGAFILIYFLISLTIAVPIMLSEFSIGRRAMCNARRAFPKVSPGTKWGFIGYLGIATAFTIISFYSVIAGWSMEFFFKAVANGFSEQTPEQITSEFNAFTSDGWAPLIWTLVFVLTTAFVVKAGIEKGIERYSKIFMPTLGLIIIGLGIHSLTLPGAGEGLDFLLTPDFSKVTAKTFIQALGQSFFSLSLGMGTMITYGSYIKKKENMFKVAGTVAVADIAVAIISGIMIFPAVFSFGISPTQGPELVFITLPSIFSMMPGGYIISVVFFFLLFLAAITSSISIFEVLVSYVSEEMRMSRRKAVLLTTLAISFTGTLCVFSLTPDSAIAIGGQNLFDLCNLVSSDYMLPIGGLFIVIFTGWSMKKQVLYNELTSDGRFGTKLFKAFYLLVRFVIPVIISILFLSILGFI